MELVIDANIFFSALVAFRGKSCDLLFSERLHLFAPEYLLEELREHEEEILKKSKLSRTEFKIFLTFFSSLIKFVNGIEFKEYLSKAEEIAPDKDDVEYLALTLKLGCSLWSNDKDLSKQKVVRIISTQELLYLLG